MTLLGAVKHESGIWIGADSRHIADFQGDSWGSTVEKLFPLGDRLVWGWYGDGGKGGRDLEVYMENVELAGEWLDLRNLFRGAIKEAKDTPSRTLGLLVAGYFGSENEPGVLHVGLPSNALVTETATFCAYCKMAALVGWESASSVDPSSNIERRFDSVLESVIRISNGVLGEPRVLWRIPPEGSAIQVRSTTDQY